MGIRELARGLLDRQERMGNPQEAVQLYRAYTLAEEGLGKDNRQRRG